LVPQQGKALHSQERSDHRDHVQMFGEGVPPIEWDTAGEYKRKAVSVFYLSHAGTVLREEQIVDVLKGEYPTGYVETGCQVHTIHCYHTFYYGE
jgi:hypothetical protein